ncbi:hypothetical protein ACDZ28_02045 [Paenibacillus sp. RS8]|uniref:hypothetical protein n=1 Tax=Paenibacillus sp. RS8 TaxID=3242681 RepID=UPI0035BFDEF9
MYLRGGNVKLSLRFKVSALVLLLVTPLFFFLYYTNIYATNIVREKVAKSASDTLTLHLGTLERVAGADQPLSTAYR